MFDNLLVAVTVLLVVWTFVTLLCFLQEEIEKIAYSMALANATALFALFVIVIVTHSFNYGYSCIKEQKQKPRPAEIFTDSSK